MTKALYCDVTLEQTFMPSFIIDHSHDWKLSQQFDDARKRLRLQARSVAKGNETLHSRRYMTSILTTCLSDGRHQGG